MQLIKIVRCFEITKKSGKSEGIYVYDYNSATGNATYKTKAVIQNPSYLTVTKDFKKVYSVSEMGKGKGSMSAFDFNPQSGELKYINSVSSGGNGPCYVSVTDNGDYVFSANYGGGSLGAIHVNENGSLDSNTQSIQHEGSSVNNDVYNHPQSEEEVNQQVELQPESNRGSEQKVAANDNPRANENIRNTSTNENSTRQAGSEITDGEDG